MMENRFTNSVLHYPKSTSPDLLITVRSISILRGKFTESFCCPASLFLLLLDECVKQAGIWGASAWRGKHQRRSVRLTGHTYRRISPFHWLLQFGLDSNSIVLSFFNGDLSSNWLSCAQVQIYEGISCQLWPNRITSLGLTCHHSGFINLTRSSVKMGIGKIADDNMRFLMHPNDQVSFSKKNTTKHEQKKKEIKPCTNRIVYDNLKHMFLLQLHQKLLCIFGTLWIESVINLCIRGHWRK